MTPSWVEQQVSLVLGVDPCVRSSTGECLYYGWKVTATSAKQVGTITGYDNPTRPTFKLDNSRYAARCKVAKTNIR
jgi:hypothetical protein